MSISVLICCYNGERFLAETLESVLAQTHRPAEVIVVDDGSTDLSAEIAGSFGSPVRVIRQANQGLPASRNVAIAAATSEFLFFIDADDLLEPHSLERLIVAATSQPDAVAIMGYKSFIDDTDDPLAVHDCRLKSFFPAIIGGNFGPQHNRLVPRETALRAGCFDPQMYIFEDWLFWCRVALSRAKLVPVDFIGAYYRRHPSTMSYTANVGDYVRGQIRVMEELSDGFLKQRDLLEEFGEPLYWACWGTLERAQRQQIDWSHAERLAANVATMVQHGPKSVRRSKSAWLIRALGPRWACRLIKAIGRRATYVEADQDPMRAAVLAHASTNG